MKISELQKCKELQLVQDVYTDRDISTGYTSDLLSDVMANAEEGSVLITIQAHKNTVAVASLVNCSGIIICNQREFSEDMKAAAIQESIAVFQTKLNQYQVSVLLAKTLK